MTHAVADGVRMFTIGLKITMLGTAGLNFLLGTLVLKRNQKAKVHRSFFALALITTSWIMFNFLLLNYPSTFLLRAAYAHGAIGISAYLAWALVLCRGRSRNVFFCYCSGLFLSLLSLSPLIVARLRDFSVTGSVVQYGLLFPLYCLYMVFGLGCMLGILLNSLKKESSVRRNQLRFVLLGATLFGGLLLLVSFVLPLLGITTLFMLDSPISIFFVGFTAYAIIKHRLMDIRLVVLRSVAYTILIVIVAGGFVLLISFLRSSYAKALQMDQDVVFVIAAFMAVFGFEPLRRLFARATDKIFYKKSYNPQKLLGELNTAMSSTVDLNKLSTMIMRSLRNEMKLSKVTILLDGTRERDEIKGEGFNIPKQSFGEILRICADKKIVVADELEEGSAERAILRDFDIAVLVPLVAEDILLGSLILGDKSSGDMYTLQDIQFLEILAPEAAIAIKNAELFEEKSLRVRELTALNKLAFSLGTDLDLSAILDQALKQVIFVTHADSGSIMLLDEESQILTIRASKGIKKEILKQTRVKVGEGIAGWVAKTKEPLILVDDIDPRFKKELKRQEIISAVTVPLKSKEKVIGVLSVNRKTSPEFFSRENLNVVMSFAGQLAVAIENAKLYKDLEGTFLGTIAALAAAVDQKDSYTYGHCEEVTGHSIAIAEELGLSQSQIEIIRIAATLHDIGKIGIDICILNKPGKLTDDERKIVYRHPTIGANILESLDFLKAVVPLILFHHERFDGTGYPSHIEGEAIPIGARIISVADSFNAMVSNRPYRKALSLEVAIRELKDNAGTQFDPQVVDAFLEVLAKTRQKKTSKPPVAKKPIPK